jgi:hypothetical protein
LAALAWSAVIAVMATTLAASAAPAAAAIAASQVPVLGSDQGEMPSAIGFGAVKPKEVLLGGDPTGMFTHLTWSDWGHATATGTGEGFYPPPGAESAGAVRTPVILSASSLGSCGHRLAYRRLGVTFVYRGHDEPGTAIRICS